MQASRFRTVAAVLFIPLLLLFSVSCYQSKYTIGSPDKPKFDLAYVGDYVFSDGKETDTFVIRNLDNKKYYVEYAKKGDDEPLRMVGFLGEVNGVAFANLRELSEDGSNSEDYLITRIGLSPDHTKLLIRNLKEGFFKDKKIESKEAFEKLIADNLENNDMYDDAAAATRVPPRK